LGLLLVALRLTYGWAVLHRMRRAGTSSISPELQSRVTSLCATLGIRQAVTVLGSTRALTPMVVGWLRPVILLPASCITGMSRQQLEAIIAHELAHIRRHDFLVNLMQCVVETLLFYHPAVWWIGRVIRQERERCCDEVAVGASGDRKSYAQALLHLAEAAAQDARRLAPAADGGDLTRRVHQLLDIKSHQKQNRWTGGLWTMVAALSLVTVCMVTAQAAHPTETGGRATNDTVAVDAESKTATDKQPVSIHRLIEVHYQKLIDGDPTYNIVIRPGDVIKVLTENQQGFVYLGGEVNRPGAYNIPGDRKLTLKQLIVSGGGVGKDSPSPAYIQLVRRVAPDRTETVHFAWDDLMEGWSQDAFLIPNDVVNISSKPGSEDDQAIERRVLRERMQSLKVKHLEVIQKLKEAQDKFGERHPDYKTIEHQNIAIEREVAAIKTKLTPDRNYMVMDILPAPDPHDLGSPPLRGDLEVTVLKNDAKPHDRVDLKASASKGDTFIVDFKRQLDGNGELRIPGIASSVFIGRPIDEVEAEVLGKMQASSDYRDADRVVITLPERWAFTASGPPQTSIRPGRYSIPRTDFRLLDALSMIGGVPEDTQSILVVRQKAVKAKE